MPRRKRNYTREIELDPRYKNLLVSQFINYIMLDGKKSVARNVFYGAMDIIEKEYSQDPLNVFNTAIKNVSPAVEVKSRRVGGANYQVPVEVRPARKTSLAFRWMLDAVRKKKGKSTDKKLAEELMDAFNQTGTVIKKKDDTQRMAEANRAFAHLR
ncbi:30S ribosomal protein S7 [bacterium]|jgi:small subunit ribosomal protein S7|nr:30S ribosomal protein S7 [Candidatus Elulimicrobium humile]